MELGWQPVAIFPHGSSNPAVCEDIFNYDPIKTTHSSLGGGAGGGVVFPCPLQVEERPLTPAPPEPGSLSVPTW